MWNQPVFYGGIWYGGQIYYRTYSGANWYWLQGGWRRDNWRGARPRINWNRGGNRQWRGEMRRGRDGNRGPGRSANDIPPDNDGTGNRPPVTEMVAFVTIAAATMPVRTMPVRTLALGPVAGARQKPGRHLIMTALETPRRLIEVPVLATIHAATMVETTMSAGLAVSVTQARVRLPMSVQQTILRPIEVAEPATMPAEIMVAETKALGPPVSVMPRQGRVQTAEALFATFVVEAMPVQTMPPGLLANAAPVAADLAIMTTNDLDLAA